MVGVQHDGAVASTGFDVLRSMGIDPAWLLYFVRTNEFIEGVCSGLQGVVYPAVRPRDVRRQSLPVAPLNEQRRIAAALDSYLSRLDDATANLERVQRNVKRYRASVLKAAVEGRLLAPESSEAVILESSDRDDTDSATQSHLPDGWEWVSLEEVSDRIESGCSTTAISTETSRAVLRSSAVRQGRLDLCDIRYLPDQEPAQGRTIVAEGDLLITRLSGSLEYVANCTVVPPLQGKKIEFPDRLFRVKLKQRAVGAFIATCFQVPALRRQLEASARSTAGHQRISLSDLRAFRIPLPTVGEQRRIMDRVDELLITERVLGAMATACGKRAATLRQSILRWAFEGRLVDQDPGDDPASVILDRIRVEKERGPAHGARKARRQPRSPKTSR